MPFKNTLTNHSIEVLVFVYYVHDNCHSLCYKGPFRAQTNPLLSMLAAAHSPVQPLVQPKTLFSFSTCKHQKGFWKISFFKYQKLCLGGQWTWSEPNRAPEVLPARGTSISAAWHQSSLYGRATRQKSLWLKGV